MSSDDEREALANLIPLDLVHDRGREGFPQNAFDAADRILAAGFHRTPVGQSSASTDKSWRTGPPAGWHTFGTHANSTAIREIEFWGRDENGLPIWERPAPTDQDEREVIAHVVADFLCPTGYEITAADYQLADRIIEARASVQHPKPLSDDFRIADALKIEAERDEYERLWESARDRRDAADAKLARIADAVRHTQFRAGDGTRIVRSDRIERALNDKEAD